MEKFSNFFHNGERNLLPNSHGKKIIWSNLFKPLKDTISKNSTWQNSWSYVIIRELQARKHNQFSAIKNVFSERQDSEKTNISWHQIEYWSFLETKISFKTLNLWQQHKGHEISKKLSRKRWQVINSLTPLFSKFESKRSRIEAFQQISHLIFWNLHLVSKFENSN